MKSHFALRMVFYKYIFGSPKDGIIVGLISNVFRHQLSLESDGEPRFVVGPGLGVAYRNAQSFAESD